jgi:hypothetical protein
MSAFITSFFFYLLIQIRRNNLDLKFAYLWLIFGLLSVLPVLIGSGITRIILSLGIENPGVALLGLAVVYVAFIAFNLTVEISKLQKKQEELIIKLAISEQKNQQ